VSEEDANSLGPAVDVVNLVVRFDQGGHVSRVRTEDEYRTI